MYVYISIARICKLTKTLNEDKCTNEKRDEVNEIDEAFGELCHEADAGTETVAQVPLAAPVWGSVQCAEGSWRRELQAYP